MNRTANGGYGHHTFVTDPDGPLLMKPQFTEAVWCCTFHGLLGLHTLKSYLVAGSPRGAFINFPVSATAAVRSGRGRWQVSVAATEPALGELRCRIRLEPLDGATTTLDVFLRRPPWAARVTVVDRGGQPLRAQAEPGYLRLALRSGAEGEVTATFAGPPRVEDRRLRPVALDAQAVSRHAGVTLFLGPHLFLADTDQPRPVLVARVGRDGHLVWPPTHRFPRADRLEATDGKLDEAGRSQPFLQLAPWNGMEFKTGAAFVFDLIAVPEGEPGAGP